MEKEIMETGEILSYFSCELFYLAGIFLNLFLFVFLKRKINTKRVSDFITSGVFILNCLILSGIFIKNVILFGEVNFFSLNNIAFFGENVIGFKFLINVFMLAFVLITYKLTRKVRFKTPVINSILLCCALLSSVLVQVENFLLIYLLFDVLTVAIYKYASNMRIRKTSVYSTDFIFIGITASVLFFTFYFMTFFIQDPIQLNIVGVCMTIAFFLKAGIFPVSNYLINRHYKVNLPYSILLFCFLPWIFVIAFNKMAQSVNLTDEIFQITISAFLLLSLVSFSLHAFKQKNLVKFFANTNYCFTVFAILNIVFISENALSVKYSTMVAFCFLSLYSLLCILKINLKPEKLNLALIKGVAFCGRFFAFLFSLFLLVLAGVIPSGILKSAMQILNNIYVFDKISFLAAVLIVVSDVLILFAALKFIRACYNFDLKKIKITKESFTKRTTLNYVVPCFVMIFLILYLFL